MWFILKSTVFIKGMLYISHCTVILNMYTWAWVVVFWVFSIISKQIETVRDSVTVPLRTEQISVSTWMATEWLYYRSDEMPPLLAESICSSRFPIWDVLNWLTLKCEEGWEIFKITCSLQDKTQDFIHHISSATLQLKQLLLNIVVGLHNNLKCYRNHENGLMQYLKSL